MPIYLSFVHNANKGEVIRKTKKKKIMKFQYMLQANIRYSEKNLKQKDRVIYWEKSCHQAFGHSKTSGQKAIECYT